MDYFHPHFTDKKTKAKFKYFVQDQPGNMWWSQDLNPGFNFPFLPLNSAKHF